MRLSKYAGERFDLVQAGGGNTSVKVSDQEMIVKASGLHLSEMENDHGYCKVNYSQLLSFLNQETKALSFNKKDLENQAKVAMTKATAPSASSLRPSIETYLHALLGSIVLHTHSIAVNAIACRNFWRESLSECCDNNLLFIDYCTPGIELAIQLNLEIKKFRKKFYSEPKFIFLQNHGLIISGNTVDEVIDLNEKTTQSIERMCGLDFSEYRLSNKVSAFLNSYSQSNCIAYLSKDSMLEKLLKSNRELFFHLPISPDYLVYCGPSAVEISSFEDENALKNFEKSFHTLPKIILYQDKLFIISQNLRKAKEIEDVLKFHLMTLSAVPMPAYTLSKDELIYLLSWEAEKYRQKK